MKNRDIEWNWEEDAQKDVKRKFSSQETQNSASDHAKSSDLLSQRDYFILFYHSY